MGHRYSFSGISVGNDLVVQFCCTYHINRNQSLQAFARKPWLTVYRAFSGICTFGFVSGFLIAKN